MEKRLKITCLLLFSIFIFFVYGNVYARDLDVSIENVKIVDKNSGVDVSNTNFSNDSFTSDIKFSNVNDYVVFEVELKNNSSDNYKIIGVTDNNELSNVEITYDYEEELNASETNKFKLKVLYKDKLVNRDSVTLNDLIITLNLMNDNGDTTQYKINNPATGDGILHYLVLLIIFITGLYFVIRKTRVKFNNKKIKIGTFILLFSIVILPFCVFAVEKLSINLKISGIVLESEYLDYTVSFNTNGGNSIDSRTVIYGHAIGELPEAFKNGYTFNGWKDNNGNAVTSSTVVKGELELTADYTLTEYNITYDLDHGSADTKNKYTIEDEFDLATPTRKGYTFAGWTGTGIDGCQTRVTIYHETGDKEFTAHWSKNENTKYYVNHKYKNLDGTYETVREELSGPTDEEVTAPLKEKYGFDNPRTQSLVISADEDSEVTYIYTRHEYTLTLNDDIETTFTNPTYPYQTEITLTAKDKEFYQFTGWSNGKTTKTITFPIVEDTNIYPIYDFVGYTVTFNGNGGTPSVDDITVNRGSGITTLPDATRDGYRFEGWYTNPTDGIKVDDGYIPDGDITLYAKWKNLLLCKKATVLHTELCERTDNKGCQANGYKLDGSKGTKTIVYGEIAGDEYKSGDAFDCDVNGDGEYDADTERFYYLRNNGENAVLIFFSNYQGEEGVKTTENYYYNDALTMLPTKEQWSNVEYDYNGRPARLISFDDIDVACNVRSVDTDKFETCDYVLENTSYRMSNTSIVRTGLWVESDSYHRIDSAQRNLNKKTSESKNAVRPVIEVPLSAIDSSSIDEVTVNFDLQGGSFDSSTDNIVYNVRRGSAIRILPNPTREFFSFEGWYTDTNYSTKVEQPIIVDDDVTYYAKWTTNMVAAIGEDYYDSLQAAISDASNTGTKTKVRLLKDTKEKIIVPEGGNVELDLQGHKVSNVSGSATITVDGATLELDNGIIYTNDNNEGMINVKNGGSLYVKGGELQAAGKKQAIYSDGGKVYIYNDALISCASTIRAAVHNKSNGVLNIYGGQVISEGLYAVYNESGSLNIGTKDSGISTSSPIIRGETYGVVANSKYNFYDGTIMGINNPIGISTTGNTPTITNDDDKSKINEIEIGATYDSGTKDISGKTYKTLYLASLSSVNRVTFDANGGTVSPEYVDVNAGDAIGELPVPVKGIYTFDGWVTNLTDGVKVDNTFIPSANIKLYAKWVYNSSDEIVNFNMINEPMSEYYNKINTWKSNESTFQANMDENFNSFNCSECDNNPSNPYQSCPTPSASKKLCDQSLGYDTGVSIDINVYESNTSKTKGDLVDYVTIEDGVIYNMIPGEIYYWESKDDSDVYGYVKANGERRIINTSVRNVRDLGGLSVDVDNDGTIDGSLKYGKIFRGAKLSSSSVDVDNLSKLGIDEEIDLRGSSSDAKFSAYAPRQIVNYQVDKENFEANYNALRSALVSTMQDVIDGKVVYFHCAIGTDRTGTLAYFLEGLLGVPEEERLQDYELSYFYGLLNRHRFYSNQPGSSITKRFTYMHDLYPTNTSIYNYFMQGSTNTVNDAKLVQDFRNAMINSN